MSGTTLSIPGLGPGPTTVSIQAQAILSIIDHSNRIDSKTQKRVIGTLLGTRSDDGTVTEVHSVYPVRHTETDTEVVIIEKIHSSLYALHKRASPTDVIVGWYSTTGDLDSFSGLVHEFYSAECDGPAVHLTMQTSNAAGEVIAPVIRTYRSSPIGVLGERAGNHLFVPVEHKVVYSQFEKAGLEWLTKAARENVETRSIRYEPSELSTLLTSLDDVADFISRLQFYVGSVVAKLAQGGTTTSKDEIIGKFLLANLNSVPSISLAELEKVFDTYVQDHLMAEYLASSVKTQIQLSSKLTTLL